MAANAQTKPTDLGCESTGRLLPSTSTIATLLLFIPKADAHFTVPRRAEGWVDLGTAIKVRSPCPRLYIAVAIAINTTVRVEIRKWVLASQADALTTRPLRLQICLILLAYTMYVTSEFVLQRLRSELLPTDNRTLLNPSPVWRNRPIWSPALAMSSSKDHCGISVVHRGCLDCVTVSTPPLISTFSWQLRGSFD